MNETAPTLTLINADSTGQDRRVHPRREFVRPCKVQRTGEVRFEAGETTNVSAGGALLKVDRRQTVRPGERIRVGVAWDSAGVLLSGSLLPARVVRVSMIDHHHQAVAVQFDEPLALSPVKSESTVTAIAA